MAKEFTNKLFPKDKDKIKRITIVLMSIIAVLTIATLPFSIAVPLRYLGDPYGPIIVNALQLPLIAVIFVCIFSKKPTDDKIFIIILCFTILSFIAMWVVAYTNYEVAFTRTYQPGGHSDAYEESWELWITSSVMLLTSLMGIYLAVLNYVKKEKGVKSVLNKKEISLENKLNEAKKLFEDGVISETEYNSVRELILAKYFTTTSK